MSLARGTPRFTALAIQKPLPRRLDCSSGVISPRSRTEVAAGLCLNHGNNICVVQFLPAGGTSGTHNSDTDPVTQRISATDSPRRRIEGQHCSSCTQACEAPPEPPIARSRPRVAPPLERLGVSHYARQGRPRGAPREPVGRVYGTTAAAPRATTTNAARSDDLGRQSCERSASRYRRRGTSKEHRRVRHVELQAGLLDLETARSRLLHAERLSSTSTQPVKRLS